MQVAPQYQPIFRELGIDADAVFSHALIKPWRTLPDRENCVLDATLVDGRHVRWHIKRYPDSRICAGELTGHRLLVERGIPTATLIGSGELNDGRSFVIFDDLSGYDAADKLIEAGAPFDRLLEPTADLAALLHQAGLHHRDLYLCHFFARIEQNAAGVRLIDTARVRPLPGVLTRTRWIVKDLAQFWYSTTKLPISDEQRHAWLARYAAQRGLDSIGSLQRRIVRKVAWIGRHDQRLRREQPNRNISIPTT